MTINYGVTKYSAWKYFLSEIDVDTLSTYELRLLERDFNKFFNYLRLDHEDYLFVNKSTELVDIDKIEIQQNTLSLEYYKQEAHIIDLKHKNNRITMTINKLTNNKDVKKQKTSNRANIIHISDAIYSSFIIKSNGVYCIHDEFLVDIYNISEVLDYSNLVIKNYLKNILVDGKSRKYNNTLYSDVYSIFILL